jgi:uncharacterized protein (TIGR03086 family)
MLITDTIDLLDEGLAWTTARIAAVTPGALDTPTPCGAWDLRALIDHTIETLGIFADALDGEGAASGLPPDAIAEIAGRLHEGWRRPGMMDRTYDLPFGSMPGPVMASASLLETVVHGWDISRASGESADIPDELAVAVLDFARQAIGDDQRGSAFGPALDVGATPSEQLVAFLGRTP